MTNEGASRSALLRWFCLGEFLTGTGLTLLGCILPALIADWQMSDARAGSLLAAQFAGASFGALLVSGNYRASVARGCWLMIAGAVLLAFFANANRAFVLFLIYGLGLGLTMTAISVLAGSVFSERRGAVLSLMNAWWGLGAVLSPVFATLWVRRWNSLGLFLAVGVGMLVLFLGVSFVSQAPASEREERGRDKFVPPLRPVLAFALVAFLYVGVEACVGGWMMSYVHRLTAMRYAVPPIATSGFWIALVCGRAAAPFALRRVSESSLMVVSMAGAFFGIVSLLLSRTPVAVVLSAAAAGFMLGPIYPLCLAKVLGLMQDSPRSKWVFATAGLGGAFLPFLTGKLATRTGSLASGLSVPLFALALMLATSMAVARAGLSHSRDV